MANIRIKSKLMAASFCNHAILCLLPKRIFSLYSFYVDVNSTVINNSTKSFRVATRCGEKESVS